MNFEQLDNANKRTTEGGVKGNFFFPELFRIFFEIEKKILLLVRFNIFTNQFFCME